MSSTKRGNDTNGSAERPNKIRRLDGETARPTTSPNPHESSDLLEKIAVLEKGRHDQAHQIKQLQKDLEGANQRVECAENKRTALIEHLQDPDGQSRCTFPNTITGLILFFSAQLCTRAN